MEFKDYYKALGVEPSADKKAIKTAYRKLARKYHPDVSDHKDAEEKFKEVTEAYEVLYDDKKRAEYDEVRQYGSNDGGFRPPPGWRPGADRQEGFAGGSDFSDFFSSMFGNAGQGDFGSRRQQTRKGRDIETDLPIFLEDTLSDESKAISFTIPQYSADGHVSEITKTLNVKIPAGVEAGERIRLKGQGEAAGPNGIAGDLYLRIRLVPHPLFDVEGHNLIITVPVAPWEAALGCKLVMPTLEGKITMSIPANSQTGQRLRVRGKGLVKKLAADSARGDLYAVLKVVMPKTTNDEINKIWLELANKAAFNARAEWSDK
ncbi:MAG: DnaJ C-terminal domain-containing protein [Zhongshania sp.]|uniref:DnaJ C-terminal domain-containing protein n=1 Tax=Zhongshania sp. TaxID=1971902 RepID=UPI00260BCE1F|nr:DnaJ C-terminal domain-containing protein [Zhongshania sp.]MDF1691731.1 DnaJ C-terminal domain-containing protein [Zhongshania sp.]